MPDFVPDMSLLPYSDFIGFHDLFYYYNILVFLRYAGKIKLRRFDISRSTFVIFSFLFDVYVLPRSDELTRHTSVQTMFPYHNVRSLNQLI